MKKKILLIIALIVLLVPAFIFLVPVKDGRTFYKEIKYRKLLAGAIQPDNYDKMKISYARIVERKTGTPNFNTPDGTSVDDGSILSNADGIDVSERDNYLRTGDAMYYTIEVGVALNLDNPEVTETTQLTGGVIKIKMELPYNDEGNFLLAGGYQAWMKNYSTPDPHHETYMEYHVPEGETIVGGNQQLVIKVLANKYKEELTEDQMPKFTVWMEGNEPDNEESSASAISFRDEEELILSGTTSYDVGIVKGLINLRGTKDNKSGQYINFFTFINVIDKYNMAGKGVAYPTNKQLSNIKVNLEYYYRKKGTYTYTKIVPDNEISELNGLSIVTYNTNSNNPNPDAYPKPTSNYSTYSLSYNGIYYASEAESNYGSYYITSGELNTMLVDNILSFTNQGFKNTYPKNMLTSNKDYSMVGDIVELFVPYYAPENGPYEYYVKATIDDYSLNNDSMMANDEIANNNDATITFENYLKGKVETNLYGGKKDFIAIGEPASMGSYVKLEDGPYLGGEKRLITFDASIFTLEKYENTDDYAVPTYSISDDDYVYDLDTVVIKYGIYKNNPQTGLTNDILVNTTVIDDFDWYDSAEEAMTHGKITALFSDNPNYRGRGYAYIKFYLSAIDTEDSIGKVGTARHKVWVYEDEERTMVHEAHTSNNANYYEKTEYDNNFKVVTRETPDTAGQSLIVLREYIISHTDLSFRLNGNYTTRADIKNEEISINSYFAGPEKYYFNKYHDIQIIQEEESPYLTYKAGSCDVEPTSVEVDGIKTTLIFDFEKYDISQDLPNITCNYYIDPLTPNETKITVNEPDAVFEDMYYFIDHRTNYFTVVNLSGSSTRKIPSIDYIDVNEPFEISGNVNNISDEALNNVKTIELLPKNGDSRNSVIHGEYLLRVKELAEGMTLYYSTGNIDEIGIETDSIGYKHIKNIDLPNDDRWIQVNVGGLIPPEATAIATLTDTIATNTSKGFTYQVIPSNNIKGDVYYFGQYASSDNLIENIFSTYKAVNVVERKISGTVFEDLNRNDLFNETDARLNNVTIELLNETAGLLDETTTDVDGHYEFSLPDKGNYIIQVANLPDGYELIPKGTTADSNRFDNTLRSDLIDQTGVAHNAIEEVGNINLGIRKKPATLVVKYLDKNDGHPLYDQFETTVYYTDPYETTGIPVMPENYSFLENSGDPVSDTVNKDYVEVIYYYDYTPATITARHFIDGTSNKIHEDVIQNKKFTQPYSTSVLDTANLNYEYVRTDGDPTSGTISKETYVVNYYYRLKKGTVTTHHYLYDNGETTTRLAPDVTREWNYTETYTTSISDQVPQNYEFYKKSNNYTAVMGSPSVEVNYYYRLKDSSLTTSISVVGTEEITSKDSMVEYEITYNAKVSDYIDNGIITINDTLPYSIDVANSDLDGGTYDDTDRTISWEIDWSDIDTYAGRDETTITKNIRVEYVGIVGRDRIMTNNVHSNILLSNSSRDAEAQASTNIRINGNIKVIYVDQETGEEIENAVEETNLVGEEFISSAIEKDGYKLVTKPDSETFEFEEEDQVITYEYEHIKYEIRAVVQGVGGKITGDEDVFWGEDSTIDNIVIEADDGYIIEAIYINGERQELVLGEERVVLSNFINVLENKNIEVIFAKKPQENPNTSNVFKPLIITVIIAAIIAIAYRKIRVRKYQ